MLSLAALAEPLLTEGTRLRYWLSDIRHSRDAWCWLLAGCAPLAGAADQLRRFSHTHTTMEIENENACHEISWRPWARCRACDDCRHVIVRATARLQLHSPIRHLRCADRAVLL